MGVVHDAIEYGISDGAVGNVVPACHGDLGRDQGGFSLIALFDNFEEAKAPLIRCATGLKLKLVGAGVPDAAKTQLVKERRHRKMAYG
jgi:hypothetical protein